MSQSRKSTMSGAGQPAKGRPFLSARARRQKLWLDVHRWLGIILLIPMAVLGVTGSAQVWPEETEALLNPAREVAASADPAALTVAHVAAARAGASDYGPLTAIEVGEVGTPLVARSAPYAEPLHGIAGPVSRLIYVDPDSAQVIDSAPSSGSFMWYMHFVHGLFLIPDVGRQVVGWMGWFLLVSAVTGLVVFWPGKGRIVAALRWRKRDGKAMNLHRQSGFLLSLVIIVEAVTGAWISFPQAMASLVEPGVEQPQRRRPPPPGGDGAPLAVSDEAWLAALGEAEIAFPGRPKSIAAPTRREGSWQIELAGEGVDGSVSVPVDGGEVTVDESEQRAGPPPPSTRAGAIATVMRQLHYATIGGIVWQLLVFLSGLALTFLAVSGIYTWGKRKLGR